MSDIKEQKKKYGIIVGILLGLLLVAAIVLWVLYTKSNKESSSAKVITSATTSTDVIVDIHPRGGISDSWQKDNAFPERVINAKIYEATITNYFGKAITDWSLRIDITENCFLNSAWNGTVEIHQFDEDEELVQKLDLRKYDPKDLHINHFVAAQDLLIPLKQGDYIIYYPCETGEAMETPITSSANYSGFAIIGFIFYSDTGSVDLSHYTYEYFTEKNHITKTALTVIALITFAWAIMTSAVSYVLWTKVKHSEDLVRQHEIIEDSLLTLSNYIDSKVPRTSDHSKRIAELSFQVAKKLGMSTDKANNVYYAALVHDVGKLMLPDFILKRFGKLTEEEQEVYKSHTVKGAKMIEHFDSVKEVKEVAMYHHEFYDGSGYPEGLKGEDIPLSARIVAACEKYDILINTDTKPEDAVDELLKSSGKALDPLIVRVLIDSINEK